MFLVTTLRCLLDFLDFLLRTIHPNPGPKRDKTEEGKARRNQRRYEKRARIRAEKLKLNMAPWKEFRIVTWNVQRMSMGTYNMAKAKQVIKIAVKEDWDLILLSEIRAENSGVKWFGSVNEDNLVAIVYSERAAILLRKDLLKLWTNGGMQKLQNERCVSVRIQDVVFTATYQPVYLHDNMDKIAQAKAELRQHYEWSRSFEIPVIGGDFNAHVGSDESKQGICGSHGLRSSNQQGRDLIQFCEENNLAYCNSFYSYRYRGSWFNNALKRWYELDGFLMRSKQRHKNVKKISTVREISLSDHKPKLMIFKCHRRKFSVQDKSKKTAKIDHEKLTTDVVAASYRQRVKDIISEATEDIVVDNENLDVEDFAYEFWNLIEDNVSYIEFNEENRWKLISDAVNKAAAETCGVKTKQIDNPWMIDKDDAINRMRERITTAVMRRNDVMERMNTGDEYTAEILDECRTELKEARKDLKKSISRWEKEWWEELLVECEQAGERGDQGTVFRLLKKIGKRDFKKAPVTTNITSDEFRNHFKKVSDSRFERDPEEIDKFVQEIPDISNTERAKIWRQQLDEIPSKEEIVKQMHKMKNSAPGEDEVRLCYLLTAGGKILEEVVNLVQYMFENDSVNWEESLKIGNVIPLHKKGDKDNPNNYRGVCLLSMGSRILARVLADRIRIWSEEMDLLDDDQAGFRKGRSTADGTQIILRIEEDTVDLRARLRARNMDIDEEEMPAGRLLDLRKAYPRVNKPALWAILKRYGMGFKCLRALQGLHEETSYRIKSREGLSEPWIPLRGLREGCPSSPPLFNVYHGASMRSATKKRAAAAAAQNVDAGISFSFVAGSNFPSVSKWEKENTENQVRVIDKTLFADDTVPLGKKNELERGIEIVKEEMARIEEANNDDKEEILNFGSEEGGKIRMLGSYVDSEFDMKQRIKRANNAWQKVRRQLRGSKMSKRLQARVVEAVVESTMLFDVNVRVWYLGDIKRLQSQVDRMYRHVWSNKNKQPLLEMQERHVNMQDVRNTLGIKSIRSKIEKRVLQRIGHVFRLEDSSLVKNVTLGWLKDLESVPKNPGKKRKTVLYWRRLLREAGIDYTKIHSLTRDRKAWRMLVNERVRYIQEWEKRAAHSFEGQERGTRHFIPENEEIFQCEHCDKICRTKAGLVVHTKKLHETSSLKKTFECDSCKEVFQAHGNLQNHLKNCSGFAADDPNLSKCACGKLVSRPNFRRHQRNCGAATPPVNNNRDSARAVCNMCGVAISKPNLARHQKTCPGRRVVL